jgi:hypothetical protein
MAEGRRERRGGRRWRLVSDRKIGCSLTIRKQ